MTLRLKSVAVLAFVAGCGGGGTEVDCTAGETPTVQVGGGTTQTGFLALQDGDQMTVVLGPQGLWMITPAVRTRGLYPGEAGSIGGDDDPLVTIEVWLDGTQVGASADERLGLTPTANGDELYGIWVPFDVDPQVYVGRTVTIRGEVNDACGRSAEDSLDVIVQQQ